MKCQQCPKPAVFHITELEAGEIRELHLCEEHARSYLNQSESAAPQGGGKPPESAGGGLVGPLGVGQTADELALLDQKACEMCGITFFEFRNQGRLGCPHDYVQFEKELEPLISNVHGSTEHVGRRSTRHPEGTEQLTAAIGMRREMREAVASEEYERAKDLRDAIREIEEGGSRPPEAAPS
jgi:protein arginine kinase activator